MQTDIDEWSEKYLWLRDAEHATAVGWNGDDKVGEITRFKDFYCLDRRWMWSVNASAAQQFRDQFETVGFAVSAMEAAKAVEQVYDALMDLVVAEKIVRGEQS